MSIEHAGTIVVVKVAGTDEIVGGYNPLVWGDSTGLIRCTYMDTNDNNSKALNSDCRNIHYPSYGNCEFMMKSNISNFTHDNECWCRCVLVINIIMKKPMY
ncbi:hypothetical protein Glove_300g75 [Diversispora epigaea]|uniref:TLDc domain-containing protein n=1 Tax=Diversispora epigaea TaxID=1348612 RepID=A0A397I1B9_9GLOM|nr:hypothetical protein Glove_300g75 [Diversispora epigaea]